MAGDIEDPEALIAESEKLDSFDFENPDDEDSYYSVELYKAPDGRHFRHVLASGMNSPATGWTGIEFIDSTDGWREL